MQIVVERCFLGLLLIARNERGVCALFLGDHADCLRSELRERFPEAREEPATPAFERLAARVVAGIEKGELPSDVPLDLHGTAFQKRVWRALCDIPPGDTLTYSALAARLGAPGSARAVGTACGKNAVAALVPCHRVVREGGGLGGYRWGLERKRALLSREQAAPSPRIFPSPFR